MKQKTLGQLAYEVYCKALGYKCPEYFHKLDPAIQIAWEETAVVITHLPHLMKEDVVIKENVTETLQASGTG